MTITYRRKNVLGTNQVFTQETRSDSRLLRDCYVTDRSWLVTGSFRGQLDATDAVLREFCGAGVPGEIDSNRLAAILGPTARLRRPKR